jgi:hypothetical protein
MTFQKSHTRRVLIPLSCLALVVAACARESGAVRVTGGAGPLEGASQPSEPPDREAVALCDSVGRRPAGADAVLRGAYMSTGNDIRYWQRTRNGPNGPWAVSQFAAGLGADEPVAVCFFDDGKDWAFPRPAPLRGTSEPPPQNRIVVLATASDAVVEMAGYHDTPGHGPGAGQIDVKRPPHAP